LAVHSSRFCGREALSFLLLLPIALPGIVTGSALRSAMSLGGLPFSFWTIVIGHATFCVVTVYNNVLARFRRTASSQIEASMDLGATSFQTFRHVVLPNIATALLAGGMLAFALSFDEVIVTTFTAGQQQTLPIWMLEELIRPRQRPVTNIAAMVVMLVALLPILAADYLTRDADRIEADAKEFAALEALNCGKPINAVLNDEIPAIVDCYRFFAGAVRSMPGVVAGEYLPGHTSMVRRDPIGIVASIAPWNYPLM